LNQKKKTSVPSTKTEKDHEQNLDTMVTSASKPTQEGSKKERTK
jgi:hypothetical protein